jgi:hypothetical protein
MMTEQPACVHCEEPIEAARLLEAIASGGSRPVDILHHSRTGHERCEGRGTLATAAGPVPWQPRFRVPEPVRPEEAIEAARRYMLRQHSASLATWAGEFPSHGYEQP